MPSVHFACPNCRIRLSAEPDQYGTPASCPECEWTFFVPHFEENERVVKFYCPHCQRKLSANENQWGAEIPCPFEDCGKEILVPRPEWKAVPTSIVIHGTPPEPHQLVEEGEQMTRNVSPDEVKEESETSG
jgi:predicted RNA-binding Zn-ribbon protein involved in translation (DUF1610 family)